MTPVEQYDQELTCIVNQLRALAADVERLGRPGTSSFRGTQVDWRDRALSVHRAVMQIVPGLNLGGLILYATAADLPVCALTPAQRIDLAASAIEDLAGGDSSDPELLADGALRAAGAL